MAECPVRLILFDCDGTLVDSLGHIHATMCEGFALAGLPAPNRAALRGLIGLPLREVVARLAPGAAESEIDAASEGYRQVFSIRGGAEGELFDGVKDTLAGLDGGALLGVATGKGRTGLARVLTHHRIRHHFSVLKTADDGPGKPAPQIVLDAMTETGASPSTTYIVGDTTFDMQMAYNAGVQAVGVAWGYHAPDALLGAGAAAVAARFSDIPALIEALGAEDEF